MQHCVAVPLVAYVARAWDKIDKEFEFVSRLDCGGGLESRESFRFR